MSDYVGDWARRQNCGGPVGKALLLALAGRADGSGRCFPGRARLLADTEMSERSLRTWIAKLEDAKLLRRERYNGYQEIYILLINERGKAADSGEKAAGFAANTAGNSAGAAAETANAAAGAADLANAAGNLSANAAGETAGAAGQTANAAAPYKEGKNNQKKIKRPQTHGVTDCDLLMTVSPTDREAEMKRLGVTPASFGKTARQMGINPRSRETNPRAMRCNRADKARQEVEPAAAVPERSPLVFVEKGSAQWQAWLAFRNGSLSTTQHPQTYRDGWWLESEWPPGHGGQAQRERTGTGG